jgi:polysaccharide biosynthesis transport protein
MVLGHLFRIIKARWAVVLFIFLATLLTTIAVSLILPKKYTAMTTLTVDLQGDNSVLGGQMASPYSIQAYLATQSEVIKSERVISKVIQSLGLETNPAFVNAVNSEAPGEGTLRNKIVDALQRKLEVQFSREGSTLNIAYESGDPSTVANVVNAFAEGYIETTLDLKTEPARNFNKWFEAQTKTYREQLEQAQKRLSAAQQASGIVASEERYDVENARLNELSQQLVLAQTARIESSSRAANSGRNGRESSVDVVGNALLQTLKADLGRAESRLDQMSSRLGTAHPEFVSAKAEVNSLRARLDSETGKVTGSISTTNTINQQRESELRSAVEAQKTKVLKLREGRNQVSIIEREVQSAQRSLDLVSQRYTETNLQSQSKQSNVSVLTRATRPLEPSRPKPMLNGIIGGFIGLFLALLAALTLEMMQKPLRDSEDLLQASGVPVLAVLPAASSRRPQRLIGSTGPSMRPPTLRLGN